MVKRCGGPRSPARSGESQRTCKCAGYSITRSLREAPALASDLARILQRRLPLGQTAEAAWQALWTPEKRRQVPNDASTPASALVPGRTPGGRGRRA